MSAGNVSALFTLFIRCVDCINWVFSALFKSFELLMADDLSSLKVCLVSALARADAMFRDLLKKSLRSCRSPYLPEHGSITDRLYEFRFGTIGAVRHFRLLDRSEKSELLLLLCRQGLVSIIKSFIGLGVDVDEEKGYINPLCTAAAYAENIIHYLLDIGVNGTLTFYGFLSGGSELSDTLYKRILNLMVESATPILSQGYFEDPYFRDPSGLILDPCENRALSLCPEMPNTLVSRGLFQEKFLIGGGFQKPHVDNSYMFKAIRNEHHSVVNGLLQQRAQADVQIAHLFDFIESPYKLSEPRIWLTLAMILGFMDCADDLIQHGANICAQDEAGRSAFQFAKSNITEAHPRSVKNRYSVCKTCTAEQDAETLAAIEHAFKPKFENSKRFEDYKDSSPEVEEESPTCQEIIIFSLKMHLNHLRFIFSPY